MSEGEGQLNVLGGMFDVGRGKDDGDERRLMRPGFLLPFPRFRQKCVKMTIFFALTTSATLSTTLPLNKLLKPHLLGENTPSYSREQTHF